MKIGIYLLLLCEICFEISKADIKPKSPKKDKRLNFSGKNKNLSISEEWNQHKNDSEPLQEESFEELTLHNFTEKTANFGFNLYRKIAMKLDNNIIISPLSVSTLMATYLLAAEGETHRQIAKALNLHPLEHRDRHYLPALFKQLKDNISMNEELLFVQGILSFIQKDFVVREDFFNLSKQYFDMEFLRVNFQNITQAKFVINQNIKQRTKGKISELFEEVDRHSKLLLLDYIFFKGKWLYPFNSKFTEIETFHINKYRSVQVPMMFKSDKVNSMYDENLRCNVIKLPYKGKAYMLIVIPEKGEDYVSLEDHLTMELVESWLANMKSRNMDISFPKFKLEQKYKMKKWLYALGIKNLFARTADLSHLTDQKYITVSQVVQKAVIEVDEKGTEAAAATGSEIIAFSAPPVIKVDRPFLFMIFEETFKTLLFIGRVVDPTEM
ncbi:protein Z-dependent protease inhibitor [Centrocercus urophasianus]|uniref:protein Z-dependent protease inhibitor n=1 Tax=Centrocercus urophasianus TaxID=9002 RepID=UPI001C64FC1B|nr:protein Z-dependent protease inhibitor [Centrocercus urophasianus]